MATGLGGSGSANRPRPDLHEPPPPWLAVAILPGGSLAATADELAMLGDAERCGAWALMETAAPAR